MKIDNSMCLGESLFYDSVIPWPGLASYDDPEKSNIKKCFYGRDDESYDIFKGFYPTIINNIIFLMNQVLENNG